jgi:hypothetical protein
VKSKTDPDFWKLFERLPKNVRSQARNTYLFWKKYPSHPGLHFKRVGKNNPIYSIRIGRNWRALGLWEGDTIEWFWIGSHEQYSNLLSRL